MKQHEHKCPQCHITFLCRGKACEGEGVDREDCDADGDCYCEHCWSGLAD